MHKLKIRLIILYDDFFLKTKYFIFATLVIHNSSLSFQKKPSHKEGFFCL
jgi:hypothetical protein